MNLLRIEQLAEKLQMSKSGVRNLLRNNQIPKPMILGDRVHVWNEATIDAWLESKERGSVSIPDLSHDKK